MSGWLSLAAAWSACDAGARPADLPTGPTLDWIGRSWRVHRSEIRRGAGPSRWTASPEALRVEGAVAQLSLQQDDRGWSGVELSTPLERRPRRLEVELDVERLDSRVVAGVFLYRDDSCEIDLEVARWGEPDALPFQYAVAPADAPELLFRFDPGPGRSRHRMRWRKRSLVWRVRSARGRQRWVLRGDSVPRFDGHRLHLNLWTLDGGPPAGDGAVSVRVGILRLQ